MTDSRRSMAPLAAMLFLQMLPATLVVAAIRPLFALYHGGNVTAMHAFMSLNMIGAILAAPPLAALAERMARPRQLLVALALTDAVLLAACALPVPTAAALALRFVEGAAHVGATTLLLAECSAIARTRGEGKVMGIAGAAIVFAIAAGNALGGALVAVSPGFPFFAGALTALAAAVAAALRRDVERPELAARREPLPYAPLMLPLTAAFVERFAVGCFVVSFALFAHARHGLSDSAVGWLYFAMTFTFAAAMAPAGRLADHVNSRGLLAGGALLYGLGLIALAVAGRPLLPVAMIVAGAGAALMFAPALRTAAAASPHRRAAAMALMNAAGCFGMTVGPVVSGIIIAAARRADVEPSLAYSRPIVFAGVVLLVWSVVPLVRLGLNYASSSSHSSPST